jgi:hypothetical protein
VHADPSTPHDVLFWLPWKKMDRRNKKERKTEWREKKSEEQDNRRQGLGAI